MMSDNMYISILHGIINISAKWCKVKFKTNFAAAAADTTINNNIHRSIDAKLLYVIILHW